MLACLLLSGASGASRDELIHVLWPDRADFPEAPERGLAVIVSRLRTALATAADHRPAAAEHPARARRRGRRRGRAQRLARRRAGAGRRRLRPRAGGCRRRDRRLLRPAAARARGRVGRRAARPLRGRSGCGCCAPGSRPGSSSAGPSSTAWSTRRPGSSRRSRRARRRSGCSCARWPRAGTARTPWRPTRRCACACATSSARRRLPRSPSLHGELLQDAPSARTAPRPATDAVRPARSSAARPSCELLRERWAALTPERWPMVLVEGEAGHRQDRARRPLRGLGEKTVAARPLRRGPDRPLPALRRGARGPDPAPGSSR